MDGGVSDTTSGVISNSNPAAGSASLSSKHPNPAPAAGSETSKKNVDTNVKRIENDGL